MKLSPRFFGPYKVLERNGRDVYRLDLPASSKIHPVCHDSCLRKKLVEHDQMQHHLPDISFTSEVEAPVQATLEFDELYSTINILSLKYLSSGPVYQLKMPLGSPTGHWRRGYQSTLLISLENKHVLKRCKMLGVLDFRDMIISVGFFDLRDLIISFDFPQVCRSPLRDRSYNFIYSFYQKS